MTDRKNPLIPDPAAPPRGILPSLRHLGPGIIIAGSIVGSGELIATTKVGAQAGFALLWLILTGCVIKVFAQVELGRHAITWGETPLRSLNMLPGPRYRVNWIVWYTVFMMVLIITQQGGIVGGVGQALAMIQPVTTPGSAQNAARDDMVQLRVELAIAAADGEDPESLAGRQDALRSAEAASRLERDAVDPYLWAVVVALLTSVLLYIGHYGLIQLLSTVLVALFTIVTIATLLLLQTTDWAVTGGELASGLIPAIPESTETTRPVAVALSAFGIIGLGAAELIMYPYWCLEKGYARWTGPRDSSPEWSQRAKGWIRVLQLDAWLSMVVYTVATAAFYLLGAAVLFRTGLDPAGSEMIRTLKQMYVPVFGPWARPIFLVGAVAVLYSTFFVAAAGMSRLLADILGLMGLIEGDEETRSRWVRRISTAWPLVAVCLYIAVRAPVAMVLASGTAQAIMLPMLGGAALYFRYRRSQAELRTGRWWDGFLWLSFAGFLVVAAWSIYALFAP